MSRYRVKALERIKSIPALSKATLGITQMIADEDYQIDALVRLIETDLTLAGRCLQSINSPLYGLQSRVDTISRAVVLLGARNIAAMALQTELSSVFRMNLGGYDAAHEDLWRNGLRTAIGARKVVSEVLQKPELGDIAYATSLMHDLGKIVVSGFLREVPAGTLDRSLQAHEGNFLAVERELFGTDHTEIGQTIAVRWHLPESFAIVMRYHHRPGEAPEAYRLLVVSAHLGDVFAMMLGTGTALDSMDYSIDPLVDHYITRNAEWEISVFPKLLLDIDSEYRQAIALSGGSDV